MFRAVVEDRDVLAARCNELSLKVQYMPSMAEEAKRLRAYVAE